MQYNKNCKEESRGRKMKSSVIELNSYSFSKCGVILKG